MSVYTDCILFSFTNFFPFKTRGQNEPNLMTADEQSHGKHGPKDTTQQNVGSQEISIINSMPKRTRQSKCKHCKLTGHTKRCCPALQRNKKNKQVHAKTSFVSQV